MDHDRLFKQLLRTFFREFIELFYPDIPQYIEPGSLTFLDKEVFTDLAGGSRHEVDLLARCQFRGQQAFFLIHVETQASAQSDFAARMFRYFARLTEEHGLPIYPIALLTYDAPQRPEPDLFDIVFPDLPVLSFRFRTLQLNRMNWRNYIRRPNPVAAALMTKMQIDPADRPRVKLECLRLLATLKLDRARQTLIRDFMDSYLRLSAAEVAEYNRELSVISPPEREVVMQIVNEWEAIGEVRGKATVVLNQLGHKLGQLPADLRQRIEGLPSPVLDEFSVAVLSFDSVAEVNTWLADRGH